MLNNNNNINDIKMSRSKIKQKNSWVFDKTHVLLLFDRKFTIDC